MTSLWDTNFASPFKSINIIKADDPAFADNPVDKSLVTSRIEAPTPPIGMPSGPGMVGGKPKTRRGILRKTSRILPSRNPSKTRKVRLMSEKSIEKLRQTAKKRASEKSIAEIRKTLEKRGIIQSGKKIPTHVLKKLFESSVGAGLLS